MNTHTPFDHDDDSAWQAQERARLRALHGDTTRGDAELLVARALREVPMPGLPADFAAQVARRAEALAPVSSPSRTQARSGVESVLTGVLGGGLCLAGVVVAWQKGASWSSSFAPLSDVVSGATVEWLGLGLLCVAATALAARLAPSPVLREA